MDGGELRAIFKGVQESVAQAAEDTAGQLAKLGDDTMQKALDSVGTVENADGASADAARGIGEKLSGAGVPAEAGSPGSEAGTSELSRMLNGGGGEEPPSGGSAEAEATSKKLPDYIQKRIDEGNAFNAENEPRYRPYNEIVLESGKRVDSYVPGDEIIERKHTQLSEVQESTAKGYIDSLRNKYKPGQLIKDSPRNRELELGGKRLKGEHILEVPKQENPVPQSIIDHANAHNVTIRDVEGREYN